jgi:hypothetical protein
MPDSNQQLEALPTQVTNERRDNRPIPLDVNVSNTPSVAVSNDVAAHRARQAWEYKVSPFVQSASPDQIEHLMNELGKDGWEYVGVTGTLALAFKRPR